MSNKKVLGILIGRFQPFHNGHADIIKTMLTECHSVCIFIGSANKHLSIKNPFSFPERKRTILEWYEENYRDKEHDFHVFSSNDYLYSEWRWKKEIVSKVNDLNHNFNQIKLYGHNKDNSSYYLSEFPEWENRYIKSFHDINATDIRHTFFESGVVSSYVLPISSVKLMKEMKKTEKYKDLVEEWDFYMDEKDKFSEYPYPETLGFMCSDAVVNCMGNILLVQRKSAPGKGTWALPGGFKNKDETFSECFIRELREETNLRVPEKVVMGSVKNSMIFDNPERTIGIPRISRAYYVEIAPQNDGSLPLCRPDSDAIQAKWFPISEVENMNLFDDHKDIIESFI